MASNSFWKKFIRNISGVENEDDEAEYYHPPKAGEKDSVEEPEEKLFRRGPQAEPSRTKTEEPEDFLEDEIPSKQPKFKRVVATGLKSAEHVVDLAMEKYVVLVNTENVKEEVLPGFRCYLAGAVRAMKGHIQPIDDENVFISREEFDVTPFLPKEENEEDDLI